MRPERHGAGPNGCWAVRRSYRQVPRSAQSCALSRTAEKFSSEQAGGESVSQSALKNKAVFESLDRNLPFELRSAMGVRPSQYWQRKEGTIARRIRRERDGCSPQPAFLQQVERMSILSAARPVARQPIREFAIRPCRAGSRSATVCDDWMQCAASNLGSVSARPCRCGASGS